MEHKRGISEEYPGRSFPYSENEYKSIIKVASCATLFTEIFLSIEP